MGKNSKAATGVAQTIEARRRAAHSNWARRHPDRAGQERALRLDRRDLIERHPATSAATPETCQKFSRKREGALARLYASGGISIEQLGAAMEIAAVAERIGADVTVRTVSLETRVDQSMRGDGGFFEALGQVRREVAYTRWRAAVAATHGYGDVAAVLDIIMNDVGLTVAARVHRMHVRRARKLLCGALDLWSGQLQDAVREIDEATLLAAQAGLF